MASFKVLHVPVTSLEDATRNAEQLNQLFAAPGTLTPFLQLLASGKVALDHGTGSVTWPGAVAAAASTVSHGLGRVPAQAWAIATANPSDGGGAAQFATVDHGTFSSTQVRFALTRYNGNPPNGTTCNFDWFVIG